MLPAKDYGRFCRYGRRREDSHNKHPESSSAQPALGRCTVRSKLRLRFLVVRCRGFVVFAQDGGILAAIESHVRKRHTILRFMPAIVLLILYF